MKPRVDLEMWQGPNDVTYPHGDKFIRSKRFKAAGKVKFLDKEKAFYISIIEDSEKTGTWYISRLVVEGFNKYIPEDDRYEIPYDMVEEIIDATVIKAQVEWGTYN
jgi:sporulation protein YlmC with PRC-barrel domain